MTAWNIAIKKRIRDKKPYSFNELDCTVKLNQNESPFDIPAELKEEICRRAAALPWNRYPNIIGKPARAALSKYLGVDEERIVVGVGSDELLAAISGTVLNPGKKALVVEPTFQMYRQCVAAYEAELIELRMERGFRYPVEEMIRTITERKPELIFIASPNSPTGNMLSKEAITELAAVTDGILVIDEAYFEFSGETALDLQSRFGNLVITRTFSKAFGLAGLRFGYMVANPAFNSMVYKVKNPFSVNVFTETAVCTLLEQPDYGEQTVQIILKERDRVSRELGTLPGIAVSPSDANFLIVDTGRSGGRVVRRLAERDIAVRDVSHYPMLEHCFRVNIGTHDQNTRFIEAMKSIQTGKTDG